MKVNILSALLERWIFLDASEIELGKTSYKQGTKSRPKSETVSK